MMILSGFQRKKSMVCMAQTRGDREGAPVSHYWVNKASLLLKNWSWPRVHYRQFILYIPVSVLWQDKLIRELEIIAKPSIWNSEYWNRYS